LPGTLVLAGSKPRRRTSNTPCRSGIRSGFASSSETSPIPASRRRSASSTNPAHDLVAAVWILLVGGKGIRERQVDPVGAVEGADLEVEPGLGLESGLPQRTDDELLEGRIRNGRVVGAAPTVARAAGSEQGKKDAGAEDGSLEHPNRMPAAPSSGVQ
jgi:hypothetical protein